MSWSVTLELTGNTQYATVKHRCGQIGHGQVESENAIDKAIEAVKGIAASGVLGDGPIAVTIAGHSNPGNKPVKDWADDFMYITITQSKPPAVR